MMSKLGDLQIIEVTRYGTSDAALIDSLLCCTNPVEISLIVILRGIVESEACESKVWFLL